MKKICRSTQVRWCWAKKVYDQFDETQLHTRANDVFKGTMVLEIGVRLLRFWGSDVMQVDFPQVLKEALWARS